MSLDAIRTFLRHPDCIIFVGSGLSMWSGLPSWTGLLEELAIHLERDGHSADLVRREVRNRDLLQAASYGIAKLTPASFSAFMRKATRLSTAVPHEIHKAVISLGPSSFITTNYDTLLEQALKQWRNDAYFSGSVTNKHLVELAEILNARSSNFVFKPHGDIGDISSIILTREQYRLLLPGGERHIALETLKTLLITRPVLYVGFGLRDPDFLYLRDLLLNIYQGSVRDHWALMPNVSAEEALYWQSQYGIRLQGYATRDRDDGTQDHAELLHLLESLADSHQPPPPASPSEAPQPSHAERVLALTRYSSGLLRVCTPSSEPIEVRVSPCRKEPWRNFSFGTYENWTTTRYLVQGPHPSLLIGLPGSGKSFALRAAVHSMASRVQQACIDDTLDTPGLHLPVLVDLKHFCGDLRPLIDERLPAGFTLPGLSQDLPVRIYLDAYNEMPSTFLEDGSVFKALAQLELQVSTLSYAIASRTTDGLSLLLDNHPAYEIERFGADHVRGVLEQRGVRLDGPFADDVLRLLSRPFFLQLVRKGLVDVPQNPKPRDIYASYFDRLQVEFADRFQTTKTLLPILAHVSFRALQNDREAFPIAWMSELIASHLEPSVESTPGDIINWLVGREVLIPYSGHRTSFVHQSFTEFCAATELARKLSLDPLSLSEIVSSKKWDQCLFLSLGMMDPSVSQRTLNYTLRVDLRLAISAVRFAEEGQTEAITQILCALLDISSEPTSINNHHYWLPDLPVNSCHLPLLKKIVDLRGSLGGDAVQLVAKIEGSSCKSMLIDLLRRHANDYNFAVNGVAPALLPLLEPSDLAEILAIGEAWVLSASRKEDTTAISSVLKSFEPNDIVSALGGQIDSLSPGLAHMLADSMRERDDLVAFALLADLLVAHPSEAVSAFALAYGPRLIDEAPKVALLNAEHVEAIWAARSTGVLWQAALERVAASRPDLAEYIRGMSCSRSGIEAIALRSCSGENSRDLFQSVEDLLALPDSELGAEPFAIFRLRDLDWQGHEELFLKSLGRELVELRRSLVKDSFSSPPFGQTRYGMSLFGPVLKAVQEQPSCEDWFFCDRVGGIVSQLGDDDVVEFCLQALKAGPDRLRGWVKTYYLGRHSGITTDDLDESTISLLLSDLGIAGRLNEWSYNPLGSIATERFAEERLLPMAEGAPTALLENLRIVLRAVGDRIGKRFVLPA